MFESIRNDLKARTLGAIWVEAERRQMASCYIWTAASTTKKEKFFFLHRIMTSDEKWIQYDNPKQRRSWGKPGHASTSVAKLNI